MLLHEAFEQASASFLVVHDLLLQCRYGQRTDVAEREGTGHRNSQGEPFDVTVEFPCKKESDTQARVHQIMLFDRDKDGLEAHGDLQSCRSSPGVREWMDGASRRLRAINGRAIGTFCCELAKDYSNRKSRDFACGLQSRIGRRKPSLLSHGVFSEPLGSFPDRRAWLAVLRQFIEHAFEVLGFAKVSVDRCEAYVSNVVERAQRLHHHLADRLGRNLALALALKFAHDLGDRLIDALGLHGTLA